ncbi:iron hydrogenase [Saitoella complicata NRRL Y-17804]|uniref:iron hydrogenase n=1 Tax=Saitoella complicata (strain BCRC 22490 / CBS 7301 / JCM 7358 / NBRC 10748 / NRRL Y-17804) TaxID=698492 RepID=UPI0008681870|nr:iron hydrogenase [Saitoella complicata NRRL Y-17804]ODQ54701.1 iron hydrogenase [Saitoella complicata NRRL Y-17804]
MSRILSADSLVEDFISPGQACIKPVEISKSSNAPSEIKVDGAEYYEVGKDGSQKKLETASISLNDCLACSGCITSAESVLITMQSHNEVLSVINAEKDKADPTADSNSTLPLIASACPGWICYAEKTHGEILPHISLVRSPQQIMGAYLKDTLTRALSISRDRVYHVSVMPCFDKKLEASRGDFEVEGVRDVDCVITTMEVVEMLKEHEVDLRTCHEAHLSDEEYYPSHPGSSAGGYLTHILTSAAKNLLDLPTVDAATEQGVVVKTIRSSDMKEYILEKDGEVLLKMATCYGFRNIQNIVRKLKPTKSKVKRVVRRKGLEPKIGEDKEYDYVEVMACPSGCINGGGQLKPLIPSENEEVQYTPKEWIDAVESTYRSVEAREASEERAGEVLRRWCGGEVVEEGWRRRALYTEYRAVEQNLSNPAFATW